MTELSPAAKAVLDAALQTHFAECYNPTGTIITYRTFNSREIATAALRAAALYCKQDRIRLLAIAEELDAH